MSPLVIFDGRCAFCRIWVDYCKTLTRDRVEYAASQEVGAQFPQIPPEKFGESVQLVFPDGEVVSGAQAAVETLRFSPRHHWLVWLYETIPLFAALSEWAYGLVAAHRTFAYHLTRFFFGRRVLPLSYDLVEWLFVRVLASIYLIAFVSFGTQARGLIGSHGILPVDGYLQAITQSFGVSRYWVAPTVLWLRHDDTALICLCIAGASLAIVLMLGFAQRVVLLLLFLLYLSLCTTGQDFMSFQWDMLLLESGFLAIFLGSSDIVIWLFRWLLFRLMFLSGAVKLMSHDPVWRNLTAMRFHYWTQPLPTPLAWYMNQLPTWFQQASTAMVFFSELLIPILFLAPRRLRHFAGYCAIVLQVLILTTGNYTFFNCLAIALCLLLFDDRWLPPWHISRASMRTSSRLVIPMAIIILLLSGFQLMSTFFDYLPAPAHALLRLAAPFGIVNTYGLFAVMTTERPEIIVQGSNDGVTWQDYEFRYKAGDVRRAPPWVAPHQPRLDWQMWFAALSTWRANPWFVNFMVKLLEGSPDVLLLLDKNPFTTTPPKYVRALMYSYRFTDFTERRATGAWWHRDPKGQYLPAISLSDIR